MKLSAILVVPLPSASCVKLNGWPNIRIPLRHLPEDLKGLHKYRVGDYRVLLWVDRENEILTLYGVRHRREVYDLLG